jgi:hypothetical protein
MYVCVCMYQLTITGCVCVCLSVIIMCFFFQILIQSAYRFLLCVAVKTSNKIIRLSSVTVITRYLLEVVVACFFFTSIEFHECVCVCVLRVRRRSADRGVVPPGGSSYGHRRRHLLGQR